LSSGLNSKQAPEPTDLYWRNLYISPDERQIRWTIGIIINVSFLLLSFLWTMVLSSNQKFKRVSDDQSD